MNRRTIVIFASLLMSLTLPTLLRAGILFAVGRADVADAVMKSDKAAFRNLLEQRADVNAAQADGATALHWAVYRDDLESIDLLIKAGAKTDVKNRDGVTPLRLASLYGKAAVIDRLIKAGADARQRGPAGETMVMLAARNGSGEAIQALVRAGADVNAAEPIRGTTALMWAAEQRHPEAVTALLEAKADFSAKSAPAGLPQNRMANRVDKAKVQLAQRIRAEAAKAGRTYEEQLELEATQGNINVPLNRKSPVNRQEASEKLRRAQTKATEEEDDDDVVHAGLVGTGGGGLTALVFAAREGDLESAKLLLDAGANVNQTTEYSWTGLLTATYNRHYQLAEYLIEHGADVNMANKGRWTALYLATDNRNIENGDFPVGKPDMDHLAFIKFLLDHGANPNLQVRDNTLTRNVFSQQWFEEGGATPFVRAAQSSDLALMKLLLAHGADPFIKTDNGDTALTAASGIGWVDGVTNEQSAEDYVETVKFLLDLGLDPNAADEDGRTSLMTAAAKGRADVIQILVDHGARLDTRDKGSWDTDVLVSKIAGHTWQAIDYADGLVRFGGQSQPRRLEAAALLRKLMAERGLPVPPPNRSVDSVCVSVICEE